MNETTRGLKVCHVTKSPLALIFHLNALCFFLDFFLSVFTEYSTFSPLGEMTSSFVNELFLTCISSLEYGASDEHGYGHQSRLKYGAIDEHGYRHSHRYSTEQAMNMVMDISGR